MIDQLHFAGELGMDMSAVSQTVYGKLSMMGWWKVSVLRGCQQDAFDSILVCSECFRFTFSSHGFAKTFSWDGRQDNGTESTAGVMNDAD